MAFMRLLAGTVAKWLIVIGLLALAYRTWRLSPLPVLGGLVASMVMYWIALQWRTGKNKAAG